MAFTEVRAAAQQALEYLDAPSSKLWPAGTQHRIITALKAALTEQVQEPVRGFEMRRCPRCWDPMIAPRPKPLTVTDLQEALVYANLIDRDAIDDPDGYDEGLTLEQIDALHRAICGVTP